MLANPAKKSEKNATYAVIQTGGKQYRVSEGETLRVEKLAEVTAGNKIKIDKVLMVGGGSDSMVGQPFVEQAYVEAQVVGNGKGKKVLVYKKKRRKGFDKLVGHRQPFTALKITKIQG